MAKEHPQVLRIMKIKSGPDRAGLGRHMFREQPTPNADTSIENINLRPEVSASTKEMLDRQQKIYDGLDKKMRKNAVQAVEYVVSAHQDYFKKRPPEKGIEYLKDALEFIEEKHGKENVTAAVIHMDEQAPHLSVQVVPIDEKGRLNASGVFGGRKEMSKLQDDFHEAVAQKHDLGRGEKGSRATHQEPKKWYAEKQAEDAQRAALKEAIEKKEPSLETMKGTLSLVQLDPADKNNIDALKRKIRKKTWLSTETETHEERAERVVAALNKAFKEQKEADMADKRELLEQNKRLRYETARALDKADKAKEKLKQLEKDAALLNRLGYYRLTPDNKTRLEDALQSGVRILIDQQKQEAKERAEKEAEKRKAETERRKAFEAAKKTALMNDPVMKGLLNSQKMDLAYAFPKELPALEKKHERQRERVAKEFNQRVEKHGLAKIVKEQTREKERKERIIQELRQKKARQRDRGMER